MATEEARGFCPECGRNVLIRRPGTNHLLHLILAIITGGLWIPIWLLCSIRTGGWRCTNCGARVGGETSKAPLAVLIILLLLLIAVIGWFCSDRNKAAAGKRERARAVEKSEPAKEKPGHLESQFATQDAYIRYLRTDRATRRVGFKQIERRHGGDSAILVVHVDDRWRELDYDRRRSYFEALGKRWIGFNPQNRVRLVAAGSGHLLGEYSADNISLQR